VSPHDSTRHLFSLRIKPLGFHKPQHLLGTESASKKRDHILEAESCLWASNHQSLESFNRDRLRHYSEPFYCMNRKGRGGSRVRSRGICSSVQHPLYPARDCLSNSAQGWPSSSVTDTPTLKRQRDSRLQGRPILGLDWAGQPSPPDHMPGGWIQGALSLGSPFFCCTCSTVLTGIDVHRCDWVGLIE